jgi:hypothetical protein
MVWITLLEFLAKTQTCPKESAQTVLYQGRDNFARDRRKNEQFDIGLAYPTSNFAFSTASIASPP